MKRNRMWALGIAAVCLLACKYTYASVAEDLYEPVEYHLYPAPEGAYVGDTMPFETEDGTLELYYLYDTDHNGQGYHPIYKYSTKNLYEYEDEGLTLNYGLMSEPDPAIGTGSVLRGQDGLYHLFYTGHNDTGNGGKGKECVMHAFSTDRETWTKLPEDTFYSPEGYSKDDFRDPEVFWVEEEKCYWMLIAARNDSLGGVVARYTSYDLKHWEFMGPLYAPMQQYMLECPDLFRMGDKYYLTYSWDCVTYYAMSESLNGPFTAPPDNVLDGTGFVFYAAKTAELNGTRYLCGWLGRAALSIDSPFYQWAGNVLNHQLVQLEDGRLGVCAPESFAEYFTAERPFSTEGIEGTVGIYGNTIALTGQEDSCAIADMGIRDPTMTLECDVTLEEDGCAGFVFGDSEEEDYTALCLDAERGVLHYEGYTIDELTRTDPAVYTGLDFSADSVHHVTMVCENEIVVLYVDDRKALSSRISHSINGAHIGVFADCRAEFSNISIRIPGGRDSEETGDRPLSPT